MTRATMDAEIGQVFDRFIDAFATFDGKMVGRFFSAPGIALRRDGMVRSFSALSDIEAYYQDALNRYRTQGCCACRHSDLAVDALSETSAVAKVSWELLRADGSVISRWRQAYFLSQSEGGWRIFGSAFMSG